MATGAGEPMPMPSGAEEANADTTNCTGTNSGAGADIGTDASCAPANSVDPNTTMNVVTPPPSMAIPPGLLPSEGAAETAQSWRLRSEAALAAAAAPPPEPEDYVRGDGWRDVAVTEFWSGGTGTGCDAGGVGGGAGRIGRAGAAERALARHERAGRRRRRHGGTATTTAATSPTTTTSTTSTTTGKRQRGGTVDGNDEEEDKGGGSLAVLRSVLASVRRGCGLSFVDLALLQPQQQRHPHQQHQQRQQQHQQQQLQQQQQPVVEIRGAAGTGKTALVLTMAAHYVAATAVGCYLDADADADDEDEDEDKAADNDDADDGEEEEKDGDGNEVGEEEEEDGGNDAWAAYGLGVAPTTSTATTSTNSANSKKRKKKEPTVSASTANAAPAPAVVVLDSDLAVHPTALAAAVRAAVLRRWGETGAARRLLDERRRARKRARRGADGDDDDDTNEDEDATATANATANAAANAASRSTATNDRNEEWRRIQSTIRDALGRIHVVRTASGGGLFADGIPALESLRRSLDLASASSSSSAAATAPPTLLLIDSLTSSDRRNQRLEAVGAGLSGRNEFYRQLQRLRAAHPVAVVATATGAASTVVAGTGADTGIATPWSKMVTARVGLERREATAAAPAGEMSGGYEYKALVPCVAGTTGTATPAGGAGGGSFVATVPFKIDSSGIWD